MVCRLPAGDGSCPWRIVDLRQNPRLFRSAKMNDLILLLVHILTTLVRLARPGGVRSVMAESVLMKHQLQFAMDRSLWLRPRFTAPETLAHEIFSKHSSKRCHPIEMISSPCFSAASRWRISAVTNGRERFNRDWHAIAHAR